MFVFLFFSPLFSIELESVSFFSLSLCLCDSALWDGDGCVAVVVRDLWLYGGVCVSSTRVCGREVELIQEEEPEEEEGWTPEKSFF